MSLVLGIVTILTFTFGFAVPMTMEAGREERVREQLMRVKRALIGEPSTVRPGSVNLDRFGYVGDMGSFPSSLADLAGIGSQTAYGVTPVIELGSGWRGPYIATAPLDFLEDPWGNALVFDTTPGTSAYTDSAVVASIRSIGRDQQSGTGDDEFIEIYEGEARSDLFGYIRDTTGNTIAGVVVTLHYPTDGTLTTATDTTDADGRYAFPDIPHGERVLEVEPNLSYRPDTAFTSGAALNDIRLTIENQAEDATSITSFTLTFTSSPPAYYTQVLINGNSVYNDSSNRLGTAVAVPAFSAINVAGTGVQREPFHVVASSLAFQIPEIGVDTVGVGGTLEIELLDFRDATSGGGAGNVNMTGVTFEIAFSDGSTTLFTTRQEP
jgi:hypothetical protein